MHGWGVETALVTKGIYLHTDVQIWSSDFHIGPIADLKDIWKGALLPETFIYGQYIVIPYMVIYGNTVYGHIWCYGPIADLKYIWKGTAPSFLLYYSQA